MDTLVPPARMHGAAPHAAPTPDAVVGPNAVVQLAAALRAAGGEAAALSAFDAACADLLLDTPPDAMVDEGIPRRLFAVVTDTWPAVEAAAILGDAGERTADYLLANRIPRTAQTLLRRLPAPLSARALLAAISRNAWTFAGSGVCTTAYRHGAVIEIADNPLATPQCPWHTGVFARLFGALVHDRPIVRHPRCCARGDTVCRFEIT